MKDNTDEIEKRILENGEKQTFTGSLEQVINELTSFLVMKESLISNEGIRFIIKSKEEMVMDDIGLIMDTIHNKIIDINSTIYAYF